MFTGLVREIGRLIDAPRRSEAGGIVLRISHHEDLTDLLELGASISVSGVCLTVTEFVAGEFSVELSPETLSRTTLGDLQKGSQVNLEPALRMGDPLGGHWVQGHIDTTTSVIDVIHLEKHHEVSFAIPAHLRGHFVEKGSVTIDGVSLTVASYEDDGEEASFSVALIPHTLEHTTLATLRVDDRVNIEVDILSKYVHQALANSGVLDR